MDFLKRFLGKKPLPAKKVELPPNSSAKPASQAPAPLPKAERNPAKDKLYGNLPMEKWPSMWDEVTGSPWDEFVVARNHLAAGQTDQAIAVWRAIATAPGLEALHYLQAWHFLRQNGVQPTEEEAKSVYGVISEQGKSGILVAVFIDGQARLYGDQGQAIVWPHPDDSLDKLIETVLGAATILVLKMKQSDPHIDSSRFSINSISILTSSGVFTKTGTPGSFETMPLIKPIAEALGQVTKALTEKSGQAP